jgi:2-aminobenzoate-CoA ligase
LLQELEKAAADLIRVEKIIVTGPTSGEYISFQELVAAGEKDFAGPSTGRDDPAIISYTSGSTGQPKGAVHFHEDLINCTEAYGQHILAPTPDDVFSGHPTMAFTFGLGALLLFPLRWGASSVLIPSFSPEKVYEAVQRHKVTLLFGTPTSFRMMLAKRDRDYDLSSLRACPSAGEPLPAAVFHQWKERFGVELLEHIGSTEMLYAFISNEIGQARPGSCGRVLPGYQARVVDEKFNEMPAGQVGQLAVKGPIGCLYWRKPERQQGYVRFGGWNFPGDLVTRDEEGYFYYQCRSDDLIVSGGYNIAAIEVEQALMESPAVSDAAVVASPDPIRGQKVKAFVILAKGVSPSELVVEELKELVKGSLAPYKYPREIEFVSYLPRTQTGKIRRFELREREMEKYQPQAGD